LHMNCGVLPGGDGVAARVHGLAADHAGPRPASPLAAHHAGIRAVGGLAADRAAMRAGHGHRQGLILAVNRDVRTAVSGALDGVVDHGALPGDHELDCLIGGRVQVSGSTRWNRAIPRTSWRRRPALPAKLAGWAGSGAAG